MKKKILLASGMLAAVTALFLVWPSPIDPLAFEPSPGRALTGALAPNDTLEAAEILARGQVEGPEDVAVDDAGRIYVGTVDGRIVRMSRSGGELETFATTDGRPLGLHFDAAGRLVVADAARGLLRIDRQGQVEVLTTEADGTPFHFTDDLDIASDGRIYFSDASSRFGHHHYLYDLMEARPHGRLLRYDPATATTETLLGSLYFANGVALSQNEDFVLVNETYRYRITRYWLSGPRAGTSDIFIDHLPGFADGVSSNRAGTFWVALFTVRNPVMDRLHPSPWLKQQVAKLPSFLWPKPAPYGLVLAIDEAGQIQRSLHDVDGDVVEQVTSVEQVGNELLFGNLTLDRIGRFSL